MLNRYIVFACSQFRKQPTLEANPFNAGWDHVLRQPSGEIRSFNNPKEAEAAVLPAESSPDNDNFFTVVQIVDLQTGEKIKEFTIGDESHIPH